MKDVYTSFSSIPKTKHRFQQQQAFYLMSLLDFLPTIVDNIFFHFTPFTSFKNINFLPLPCQGGMEEEKIFLIT